MFGSPARALNPSSAPGSVTDDQAHDPIIPWPVKDGMEQGAACCAIFTTKWELQKTRSNTYTVCFSSSYCLYFTVNMFHNLKYASKIKGGKSY